ncbi:MAG: hypothetical protein ABS934_09225, partial [Psychrobacillus sp.]
MTEEGIKSMLKTLCEFNDVHIAQTFTSKSIEVLKVRCLENSNTIEITNLTNNTVKLFNDIEETVEAI